MMVLNLVLTLNSSLIYSKKLLKAPKIYDNTKCKNMYGLPKTETIHIWKSQNMEGRFTFNFIWEPTQRTHALAVGDAVGLTSSKSVPETKNWGSRMNFSTIGFQLFCYLRSQSRCKKLIKRNTLTPWILVCYCLWRIYYIRQWQKKNVVKNSLLCGWWLPFFIYTNEWFKLRVYYGCGV